jgi:hypothetical protein
MTFIAPIRFDLRRVGALLRLALFAALCALAFVNVNGQTTSATLGGTVTDENNGVVPGVELTILNDATSFKRETTTNTDGSFTVPLLPPGTYRLSASHPGFETVEVRNIVLNVNDRLSLRVQLKVGDVKETVSVAGDDLLITDSASVSTTIDRQFVANLPLNGRTFQSLILLTPGVVPTSGGNGAFSINGNRSDANYFTVDGVSANAGVDLTGNFPSAAQAGALPATTASGMTQNLVTVDSLQEFKIQTSSYSAEFGRQPGGQIQLVTRSGDNTFHGSAFDYVRNEAFEANDWFANSIPLTANQRAAGLTKQPRTPLRQQLFGGTFSGPIFLPRFGEGGPKLYNGKNKSFFFFSYEALRLKLPRTTNTLVPSLELRRDAAPSLRPLLNAFPLPTGPQTLDGVAPYFAVSSDPTRHDALSLRVDQKVGAKLELFGRVSRTPSESRSRSLGQINGNSAFTRTVTLGANKIFSGSLSSETRFNYTLYRGENGAVGDPSGGAVPITASQLVTGYTGPLALSGNFVFQFSGAGVVMNVGDFVDSFQRQYNTVENLSWIKRQHSFKFGFDHRREAPIYGPTPYRQQITVTSANNIRAGIANVALTQNQGVRPIFDNFSAYAQDTWKAGKNLTLDLGLRWELNPAPHDANGIKPVLITGIDNIKTATLAPPGSSIYKTFYKAFAPRVGAAYQLSRKPGREMVIRGNFGYYYDLGNTLATQGFTAYPFTAVRLIGNNLTLPLTAAQAAPQSFADVTLPNTNSFNALNPDLVLPYTLEWNLSAERSLGGNQAITVSYVASAGRRLLQSISTNNFVSPTPRPNPNFGTIFYTVNGGTSDYNSLQAQFRRRLSKGLQALVSYTWAHAIDKVSTEGGTGIFERGNSNFDIRHNFSAATTYNLPKLKLGSILTPMVRGWSIDTIFLAHSGTPIDLKRLLKANIP